MVKEEIFSMATADEIERRVSEADASRRTRRTTAARRVGELAARHAAIVEQLAEIERELGEVLVGSSDVLEIAEVSLFTDVPATDLARWYNDRKNPRAKRKKPSEGGSPNKTRIRHRTVPQSDPARRNATPPDVDTPGGAETRPAVLT